MWSGGVYEVRSGLRDGGFQPAVEPAEEHALPHDGVLGLENPVVLIGEDQHLGGNSTQTGGVEGHFSLGGKDAEVIFAVGDKDGGVPIVDKFVGRVGESALGDRIVFVPECSAHVPVDEPHFLGFEILGFHVEDSRVGDECGETALVDAGEHVH